MSIFQEFLGPLAALMTTCSFMPQVYHTWKQKSVNGLSWNMLSISVIAALLWLSYGISMNDYIIVISNLIMGTLQLSLIYLKIKFSITHTHNAIKNNNQIKSNY